MTSAAEAVISHPSCYHIGYALSCAEFDGLLAAAQGRCAICEKPTTRLYIDHDHELGRWGVRGLVCPRCNQQLRRVDSGEKPATAAEARYLADAWHLHQPSSTIKRARVKLRIECGRCGLEVSMRADGRPQRHWSRLPGESDLICGETKAFTYAIRQLLKPPRYGCPHPEARIHKSLCYACGTFVGFE